MSMLRREIVRHHGWVTDDEYLEFLSLAQLLPGSNPINVAILVGAHVAGPAGAAVAFVASVLPGFIILTALGVFAMNAHAPWITGALRACAAVAVGLALANAVELTARRLRVVDLTLIVAVAASVVVLHLSLALALVIFVPIALVLTRPRVPSA